MRLGLLIKDTEYREALAEKLSTYDNNIFVNIIDGAVKSSSRSLIVTDIRPEDIETSVLDTIKKRTVFLTETNEEKNDGCRRVFKYGRVAGIISELSIAYNEWHGEGPGRDYTARIISVCCESDGYAAEKCRTIARHIIYSVGGSVLILPLSYINDYGIPEPGSNLLSKLLYSIHSGRMRSSDSFTYTDSYGVSALMLPEGLNPVAYLDEDELKSLAAGLAERFDTIICDAGTCFRNENISILKDSDHLICFGTGRRASGIDDLTWASRSEKITRIKITGETDEAVALDDCIKQIFLREDNDHSNSRNDEKTRK